MGTICRSLCSSYSDDWPCLRWRRDNLSRRGGGKDLSKSGYIPYGLSPHLYLNEGNVGTPLILSQLSLVAEGRVIKGEFKTVVDMLIRSIKVGELERWWGEIGEGGGAGENVQGWK